MPCNPSIGGTAKGVIVREIDALGGLMGKVADKSHFQIKMLNDAKGPAVRSLRCQADKVTYPKNMLNMLKKDENLEIIEEMRVFVNSIVQDKPAKKITEGDIITIRGKGKFIVDEFLGKNKKGKEIIKIKKYK